jgi:hypothetical protein
MAKRWNPHASTPVVCGRELKRPAREIAGCGEVRIASSEKRIDPRHEREPLGMMARLEKLNARSPSGHELPKNKIECGSIQRFLNSPVQ